MWRPATRTASAIAANRNGDVAVVWEDDRDTTDRETTRHSEIYLRLFHNGVSSYEIKLSAGGTAGTNWKHITPDVGLDDRGNAVVVWADDPDGNGYYNVPYRVVSPTGTITASGAPNASASRSTDLPEGGCRPDGTPGTPPRSRSPSCGRTSRAPRRRWSRQRDTPPPRPRRTR